MITITYHDAGDYRGTVRAGGYSWRFDALRGPAVGFGSGIAYDSAKAYDKMAASAVSFGSYYTTYNRDRKSPMPSTKPHPGLKTTEGNIKYEEVRLAKAIRARQRT